MDLVLFDLDNTLLAGDSDYEWAQFLIERGVLDRGPTRRATTSSSRQYKAGTLDIYEFLDFQLAPLARHPRAAARRLARASSWTRKIRPMIGARARSLVARHLARARSARSSPPPTRSSPRRSRASSACAHLIATEPEARRRRASPARSPASPCFREGKVARLEQWLAAIGRPLASFAASSFYSDSHNDLPLLERVTHPVAVDPDDALRRVAASRGWPVISLR